MDDFVRFLFLGFFLLFCVPALFFCLFTFLFTSLVAAPLWKFQGGRERVNTRKQPSQPLTREQLRALAAQDLWRLARERERASCPHDSVQLNKGTQTAIARDEGRNIRRKPPEQG